MVTSKNGIIHTYIHIYIYMRCNYVHLQPCTHILDVSKRGVLGSADDDIAFFCIFCHLLFIMGRSISFHWFLIILTMVFNMFHCFFHYMVQPKVIMPPWWKDMGFKKKNCVPREKSGRHSSLIYLVLNPPKKIRDGIQ